MSPKPTRFGLSEGELQVITSVLHLFPEVDKGVIFGSRAKGSFKRGSDIDIALFGKDINVSQISYQLNEETLLPYFFDILDYEKISFPELKEHVDRVGLVFYTK